MSDKVPVDLEDLDARDGWILEISIDQQGGTEVAPLLVEILLSSILCSPTCTASCAAWRSCKKEDPVAGGISATDFADEGR